MEPQASGAASRYENALADEILAEVARRRITSKSVQEAAGVKPRAWTNYLTARTRDIPMAVVIRICDALDIAPSEMLRRAEARGAELAASSAIVDDAISQASPAAQEALRGIRRDMGHDVGDSNDDGGSVAVNR